MIFIPRRLPRPWKSTAARKLAADRVVILAGIRRTMARSSNNTTIPKKGGWHLPTGAINTLEDLQILVVAGETDWKKYGEVRVFEKTFGDKRHFGFDYLPTAEYAGVWSPFERMSRGLVIREDGTVCARPFDKFFNYGQHNATTSSHIQWVTKKEDGSMGIVWYDSVTGDWQVNTRGAFDSDQAAWAKRYLDVSVDKTQLNSHYTYICEIVYPENRIVVDYKGFAGLILIGIRHNSSGALVPIHFVKTLGARIRGLTSITTYEHASVQVIQDLLKSMSHNEEGFVVYFADGMMAKFKGDQYLKVHRIRSHLTLKHVYELFVTSDTALDQFKDSIPDELVPEYTSLVNQVHAAYHEEWGHVATLIMKFDEWRTPDTTRKDCARWIADNAKSHSGMLFKHLDGKTDQVELLVRKNLVNRLEL